MKHFIFGGRFGDICHSLPAVYEYAMRTGLKPRFTAAAEFASILEGCTYLEAHAAPCQWSKIQDIKAYCRAMYPKDDFAVIACYGLDYSPEYKSSSYLRESWRLSACPIPPERVPLIFDNRDPIREDNLIRQYTRNCGKPFILVSTHGKSSPFSNASMLLEDIAKARPDCDIVDISQARAPRVYDLIGLFEKAVALVTIDTMHLHLSAAVPSLPVFAFICNGPSRWNRTDWRPQQVWRCTYAEYPHMRANFRKSMQTMSSIPKIYHVWAHLGVRSIETQRRMKVAQESWKLESDWAGNWIFHECTKDNLHRLHSDMGLPYVHDIINSAIMLGAADTDIISFSNSDVGCIQGVTSQILDAVHEQGCAYTHRHDMQNSQIEAVINSESEVGDRCAWYPGSDWFFMTVAWWKKHMQEVPDLIIGREFWDAVLRQIMKKYGTKEICKAVWHEKHPSMWEQPGNRENLAGNKHNRRLAMAWFAANHSDCNDPFRSTWNLQPGITKRVDPHTISRGPSRSLNLIFPQRLQVVQNTVRRIVR